LNGDGLSEISFNAARKEDVEAGIHGEIYLLYGYRDLYPQVFKTVE
jgi:hypothetical protein